MLLAETDWRTEKENTMQVGQSKCDMDIDMGSTIPLDAAMLRTQDT